VRRKRVLVVAYYFPPVGGGGVSRSLKLVRALAADGWHPLVLTVDRAAWPQDPALLADVPRHATVLRLPNPDWGRVAERAPTPPGPGRVPAPGRGRGRLQRWLVPDLHVGWSALAAATAATLAAARAVDAVYTTAPPYSAHLAGWAARAAGVPWVADFRDAWTDNHARTGLPAWRRRVETALERSVLGAADRVVFASEGARERAVRRLPSLATRSETVLTGFDAREFGAGPAALPPAGRLVLVHAGSVALDRKALAFERLLGALAAWQEADPTVRQTVLLRLVGAEEGAAERIARHGVGEIVRVEPRVPRSELAALLQSAHACVYLAPEGERGGDPVPGKLFDAVGAGRPLLALAPAGALARLVSGRGLGRVVDPERRDAIVAALESLRAGALRSDGLAGPGADSRAALCTDRTMPRLVAALDLCARGGMR
jgi:glycosyltransferase involved in cell wall biosynthesis